METHDDQHVAELLSLLPPAPARAVRAAQELPLAAGTVDAIVARAQTDDAYRQALIADLEAALAADGHAVEAPVVEHLRRRLADL